MKMSTEFKDLTAVELTAKGRDLRQEMFNLRLQQASASWKSRRACATLRKDIARIETQISATAEQEQLNFVWLKRNNNGQRNRPRGHRKERTRRSHLQQDDQDDRRARGTPFPASAIQESRHGIQEILRARREERSQGRRSRADRGNPSAFEDQTLAADEVVEKNAEPARVAA